MPKLEITWTGESPDGGKRQVCARTEAGRWVFLTRTRRFENWEPLGSPPLEDWLQLLDGVRRRGGRHLATREDEKQLVALIRRLFPGAQVAEEPRE